MATNTPTVSDLHIGDVILPPARELQLWMRRHVKDHGLSDDALRLTITAIREGHIDKRGRWIVITCDQDAAWGARFPFTFKARPETTWLRLAATQYAQDSQSGQSREEHIAMTLHTPPRNQGQIVEVSYGWVNETLYQRVHDRSDRSTHWYCATAEDEVDAYIESGREPWNEEPAIETWTPCDEPHED